MKCEDFFIIKLRYYADEKVLNKFYKTPGHESQPLPKQHWERAQLYTKFYWDFIEKVTGKNQDFWFKQYMFNTKECVEDEIKGSHGIIIQDCEGWYKFFIPIKHTELIEWIQKNTTIPTKIIKKTNMFWINHWGCTVNTERRTEERKHTIEFCKKLDIKL